MQAFSEFRHMPPSFWAMIKYVSETLGYTIRRQGVVRTYSVDDIHSLLSRNGIVVDHETIEAASLYFDMRADLLNNVVRHNLMNATEAKAAFESLYPLYCNNNFKCKLPMNKQKGPLKQIAFFTAIINILAEDTLRHSSVYDGSLGFNDDPGGLAYVFDSVHHIIGASSRRFDGAYPHILNPRIVWKLKNITMLPLLVVVWPMVSMKPNLMAMSLRISPNAPAILLRMSSFWTPTKHGG